MNVINIKVGEEGASYDLKCTEEDVKFWKSMTHEEILDYIKNPINKHTTDNFTVCCRNLEISVSCFVLEDDNIAPFIRQAYAIKDYEESI